MSSRIWLTILAVLFTACSGPSESSPEATGHVGTVAQRDTATDTGFVPFPKAGWDGTLVDLLAADALGGCVPWWRAAQDDTANIAPGTSENDAYLTHLLNLINRHQCIPSNFTPPSFPTRPWLLDLPSLAMLWTYVRSTYPTCNVDQDGHDAVISAPSLAASDVDARWASYDLLTRLNLNPASDGAALTAAKKDAAAELGLAGTNLCMASRLREEMLSADVLVASGSAQRELLEVIRQRAQLAILQFTLVGEAFSDPNLDAHTVTQQYQILPLLRQFRNAATTGTINTLSADFAEALRLYIDSATELTELLSRSAAANTDLAELGGYASNEGGGLVSNDPIWGDASWRSRSLNLVYGGDPLGAPRNYALTVQKKSFNEEWGTYAGVDPGGLAFPSYLRLPHVLTRLQGPETTSLLGLASQADALYLVYNAGAWNAASTGLFLYRAVEAYLQRHECLAKTPTGSCVFHADDASIATTDYTKTLLWTRYHVTPSHAANLAQSLVEAMPKSPSQTSDDRSAVLNSGTFSFVNNPPQLVTDVFDRWLHLPPKFAATDLTPAQIASPYTFNFGIYMPTGTLAWDVSARMQGFTLRRTAVTSANADLLGFGANNLSGRYMGVVPTLAAVRDGLLLGKSNDSSSAGTGYYRFIDSMLKVIDAAIGPVTFSVRPALVKDSITRSGSQAIGGCPGGLSPCPGTLVQDMTGSAPGTTNTKAVVHIVRPISDPPAELVVVDQATLRGMTPTRPGNDLRYVASVAQVSTFTAPDFANLTTGFNRTMLDSIPGIALSTSQLVNGYARQQAAISWTWNNDSTTPGAVTTPNGGPVIMLRSTTAPKTYTLLADGIGLHQWNATAWDGETRSGATPNPVMYCTDGRYGSLQGAFNANAVKLMASVSPDFAKPGFSPFGIPTNWIPPTNPDLFGGNTGEDSVSYYLRTAKAAADDATTAVRAAMDQIIAEKADAQKLQASRDRATSVATLEVEQFCGVPLTGGAGCNTQVASYVPKYVPTCDDPFCNELSLLLLGSLPPTVGYLVLQPVADALNGNDIAPAFPMYAGGQLQKLALDQYNAIRNLERESADAYEDIKGLAAARDAAYYHLVAVSSQLQSVDATAENQYDTAWVKYQHYCDPAVEAQEQEAAYSYAVDCPSPSLPPPNPVCYPHVYPNGYNSGPELSALQMCFDAGEAAFAAQPQGMESAAADARAAANADALVKTQDLMTALANHTSKIAELARAVSAAQVGAMQAVNDTNVAVARTAIDAAVEQSGTPSQLLVSKRYNQYDMWRARALLEDARRLSATARRAIESRFAVDFSTMHSDESFVAAPALWADEVYEYDLDAPAAVGLSLAPQAPATNGIYPSKLSDYVKNLQDFVSGYSVRRPTATAQNDTEIITLPGPAPLQSADPRTPQPVGANAWAFQCSDGTPWVTNPASDPQGNAPISWPFLKNRFPPFDNEGFGSPLQLIVLPSMATGPVITAPGGRAANLTNNYLLTTNTIAGLEPTTGLTAITWVNLRSFNATRAVILGKQYQSVQYAAPFLSAGLATSGTAGAWNGNIVVGGVAKTISVSTPPLVKNQWAQLALTFDGHVEKLYMNGAPVGTPLQVVPASSPPVTIDWGQHGPWNLGGHIISAGEFVDGWIGPTMIDVTAYSDARIAALYATTLKTTQPSLAWQFNESSPPYQNSGLDGVVPLTVGVGNPPGPVAQSPVLTPAIDLDGNTALRSDPTSTGESPAQITISGWVNPRTAPVSPNSIELITKNYNASTWASPWWSVSIFETSTGTIEGYVALTATSAAAAITTTTLPLNKWTHLAMTYDGYVVRMYVNGVQQAISAPVPGAPALISWGGHGAWSVGGNPEVPADFLNGPIAGVRIEPRVRSAQEIADLYSRGRSGICYQDDACVGNGDCCPGRQADSPLRSLCNGVAPVRAKVEFHLDPWGRQNDYYARPPFTARHNVRWGRLAVNLVGTGVRDCAAADDPGDCYAASFLRYTLNHSGPSWVLNYDSDWLDFGLPIATVEGGKALAVEEWLDPVQNSWNESFVTNVQRTELQERPVDGAYELQLDVPPDTRLDRIERVQLLMETNYWVREQ